MPKKITDQDFIDMWKKYGSPAEIAEATGITIRSIYTRRRSIEAKLGITLTSDMKAGEKREEIEHNRVIEKVGHRNVAEVKDGHVIVFSDAHIWPGDRSIAMDAMIKLIKDLQPKMIINNGDIFDGAKISRHPPAGWSNMPEVVDELEACIAFADEVEAVAKASRKNCSLLWNAGNHDTRFSARLATVAPEFVKVKGMDLKDHFPAWQLAWSTFINDNTVVKHRWKGGQHAAFNNTKDSGRSLVTGHLHKCMVTPFADYNGRRYGVDCGTLSDFGPTVDKFTYGEDSPFNWGQGFAVLTYDKQGRLLPPSLCEVIDGRAYFERKMIAYEQRRK